MLRWLKPARSKTQWVCSKDKNMSTEQVTKADAQQQATQVFNVSPQQYKEYIDDQLYVTNLIQSYLNKFDNDNDKAKFVTFSRGIVAEIEGNNPGKKVGRTGDFTYKQVFDLATDTLKPATATPPVVATPDGTPPVVPSNTRTPGDVVVEAGNEVEDYVERLGHPDAYAAARMALREKTKTLKTYINNENVVNEILDERAKATQVKI